jgi:hypothetical protein
MRSGAAVHDVHTSVLVLVRADGGIGYRAIGDAELLEGNARRLAPVELRSFDVEALVEVHARSKAGLVDQEVSPEPNAREANHRGIAVREHDRSIAFRTLSCVERHAGGEERVVREPADAVEAGLGPARRSRPPCGRGARWGGVGAVPALGRVNGTSRTQRETDDFETPGRSAMSNKRSI